LFCFRLLAQYPDICWINACRRPEFGLYKRRSGKYGRQYNGYCSDNDKMKHPFPDNPNDSLVVKKIIHTSGFNLIAIKQRSLKLFSINITLIRFLLTDNNKEIILFAFLNQNIFSSDQKLVIHQQFVIL